MWKLSNSQFKKKSVSERVLLSTREHSINGSPVKPDEQLQIALWLTTLQMAFGAHTSATHGVLHCWLRQALSWAHSELITHSGRQFGGIPINSAWHEHTACWFTSWHWLYGPHGDGSHGFIRGGIVAILPGKAISRLRREIGRFFFSFFFHQLKKKWKQSEAKQNSYLFHIDYMRSPGYQYNQYHRHNLVNGFEQYRLKGFEERRKLFMNKYSVGDILERFRCETYLHWCHTHRGMDLCIYYWCRLWSDRIRYFERIRGDSPCMDHQSIRISKRMSRRHFVLYKWHLHRTVMVRRDSHRHYR